MSDPTYLTVAETAAILRCHPETVRRMLRRGDLSGKRAGAVWLVWTEGLDPEIVVAGAPQPQRRRVRAVKGQLARRARQVERREEATA